MPRLKPELLGRVESFCDRVMEMASALEKKRVSSRIVDQVIGSGTSVGANLFEADEAMSRADFSKCVAICVKELNETRFWIRLVGRREWIQSARLRPLEIECVELKKVLGSIVLRSRRPVGNASMSKRVALS